MRAIIWEGRAVCSAAHGARARSHQACHSGCHIEESPRAQRLCGYAMRGQENDSPRPGAKPCSFLPERVHLKTLHQAPGVCKKKKVARPRTCCFIPKALWLLASSCLDPQLPHRLYLLDLGLTLGASHSAPNSLPLLTPFLPMLLYSQSKNSCV